MTKKHNNLLFYWMPIFIYCLLIFIQSSYPSAIGDPELPHIDKLAHFLGYALLGVLFFRAFMTLTFRDNDGLVMILSIVSSVLYGISDEIHQHYVPFRNADITDILADTLGSFCGVFFYQLFIIKYYDLCKATLRSLTDKFASFAKKPGFLLSRKESNPAFEFIFPSKIRRRS